MYFTSFSLQNFVWYYDCPHFTEEETEAKFSTLAIKPLHEPHFLLTLHMPFWRLRVMRSGWKILAGSQW